MNVNLILGFYKYLLCLMANKDFTAEFVKLGSKNHTVQMQKIRKKALSNFDDKVSYLIII